MAHSKKTKLASAFAVVRKIAVAMALERIEAFAFLDGLVTARWIDLKGCFCV